MNTPIDDGGPAFPIIEEDGSGQFRQCFGMSLRDWFAGRALVGSLSSDHCGYEFKGTALERAEMCYKHADAMLAARKEKPGARLP